LIVAIRDRIDLTQVPDISVQWADAATRSVAQEADATVKLFQTGLLPRDFALKKLGYTDAEIAEIRAATPVTPPPAIAAPNDGAVA